MTSATTSDTEIVRNLHQPEGWRRDGIDFFVAPPPRCHYNASSSLRELDAVALATNVTIFMERGTYPRALADQREPSLWTWIKPSRFLPAAPVQQPDRGSIEAIPFAQTVHDESLG